jgi:uncharacterized integral membrane protein
VKYLAWLLKAAIFFLVFAFALNNQDDVRLNLLFGAYWHAPLVLVLLAALTLGVFLGIAVMLPLWLRARRQSQRAAAEPAPLPDTDRDAQDSVPHGI